ncbi:MAG: potassium transporter Kup [Hyphomicrobiaceae bacterium]
MAAQAHSRAALTLAALGVVYGDIGTSPLYALKETLSPNHGIPAGPETVLGAASAIFWALMLVVSLKYVLLVLRADNHGEGGIMALLALARQAVAERPRALRTVALAGMAGTALFYGDAVLTPAISVLSAVEGLSVGTHVFEPYVLPLAIGILMGLFVMQQHGTASVGAWFGPIALIWFTVLAAGGVYQIAQHPQVLEALYPDHAWRFVTQHGFASFAVLGAVLLAFTGAEALYADMGHFGRVPIRLAWYGLVFPALMLNYLGQGALLSRVPAALSSPFFLLYPTWALYPMVLLATAATVIAAQATITGAFSLTRQAMQLGYLPRMQVVQTSSKAFGQIYIPVVNWLLFVLVVAVVAGFGGSSRLASAYGLAVTGTMLVTTLLTFFVIHYGWGYGLSGSLAVTGMFLLLDAAFFSSSLLKISEGGWFPLVLGSLVFIVMRTWVVGRRSLLARVGLADIPLTDFLAGLMAHPPTRVPGTAVFLNASAHTVPHALLHNLNHNRVLHERLVFLTVRIKSEPWVPFENRMQVESLGNEAYAVTLTFGFKNRPDVPAALEGLGPQFDLVFEPMQTSYFLSRETIVPSQALDSGMAGWREHLFRWLSRNAGSAVEYFNLPANRVIELGSRVEI